MKITIYTQNCSWWPIINKGKYFSKISDFICQKKPDIVFLQEIFSKKWIYYFNTKDYNIIYQPKKMLIHGGLVILVRKNIDFKIKNIGTFKAQFGKHPFQFLSSLFAKRGFLHVYLPLLDIHLINTHLTAGFSKTPKYSLVRFLQVKELKEYIWNFDKVVFGGDLNFHENSYEHNFLKRNSQDLSEGIGNTFPIDNAKYDYLFCHKIKTNNYESYLVSWKEKTPFLQRPVIDHSGILSKIWLNLEEIAPLKK
jgi:endonuclease/exonuclease/phosphatase family metal-dependent hydrolase